MFTLENMTRAMVLEHYVRKLNTMADMFYD